MAVASTSDAIHRLRLEAGTIIDDLHSTTRQPLERRATFGDPIGRPLNKTLGVVD